MNALSSSVVASKPQIVRTSRSRDATRFNRILRVLVPFTLFAQAMVLVGCVSNAGPPGELLVVTSRRSDPPNSYEFRVIQPDHERVNVSGPLIVGHADALPLPTAAAQDGAIVALVPTRGATEAELQWIPAGATGEKPAFSTRCAQLLETFETRVAVLDRAPQPRSSVKIEDGHIVSMRREYVTISIFDVDSREQVGVFRDVFPLCRVDPGVWLVVRNQPPVLAICNIGDGSERTVCEFEADRWISGVAAAPAGAWVCIASQASGASWNFHRLDVWDRKTGQVSQLISDDVYVSNRSDSSTAPDISPTALSEKHLAFVATQVTEWDNQTPTDGHYCTMIFDVPAHKALARIMHMQPGLSRATPQPYLPENQLRNLRIRNDVDEPPDKSGLRRYFTLRGDAATGPRGRSYPISELTLSSPAASQSELAVRRRFGGSSGSADEVILILDGRELDPIAIPRIERLTWLPRRPIPGN